MRLAAAALAAVMLDGCAAGAQAPAAVPAPVPAAAARVPAAAPVSVPGAASKPALNVRNASFEADMPADRPCPVGWDCTTHNDPKAFRFFLQANAVAGARSLCIERAANEPWALMTQSFESPLVRGARLRLSMSVLVEGVSGEGAGPWALVQGNPPLNPRKLVRGTSGWQRIDLDIAVPASGRIVEVGATLEGPGKACFDDVRLEFVGS